MYLGRSHAISVTPPGVIIPFGGNIGSIPLGYLACDGSVVSQASYPTLFAAIGSAWDTGGEGVGNFRLPDLRGRGFVGQNDGNMPNGENFGLTTRALAAGGGQENVSHSHSAGSLTASVAGDHDHTITVSPDPGTFLETNLGATYPGNDGLNGRHTHNASSNTTGGHGHPISGTSGSDNSSNMSPFAVAPFIIKT